MQTVEVQIEPPKLLQVPEDCAEGWQLHLVDLPDGYVGALAVDGEMPSLGIIGNICRLAIQQTATDQQQ